MTEKDAVFVIVIQSKDWKGIQVLVNPGRTCCLTGEIPGTRLLYSQGPIDYLEGSGTSGVFYYLNRIDIRIDEAVERNC